MAKVEPEVLTLPWSVPPSGILFQQNIPLAEKGNDTLVIA